MDAFGSVPRREIEDAINWWIQACRCQLLAIGFVWTISRGIFDSDVRETQSMQYSGMAHEGAQLVLVQKVDGCYGSIE